MQNLLPQRGTNGRWTKGISGNRAGRPAGSRNQATIAIEQMLDGAAEQLTAKAIELAKEGNIHALRLCFERILPVRKERPIELELTPLESVQDLPENFRSILAAVAEGRLTPGEAAALARILTSHAQTFVLADFDRRVQGMESRLESYQKDVEAYRHDLDKFLKQPRT